MLYQQPDWKYDNHDFDYGGMDWITFFELDMYLWGWTALMATLTFIVSALLPLGYVSSLILFAACYGLQDLAHLITREPTYESSYTSGNKLADYAEGLMEVARRSFAKDSSPISSDENVDQALEAVGFLSEHSFYLLALVVDSVSKHYDFSWLMPRNRVVLTKIKDKKSREDLVKVKDWVLDQKGLNPEHTSHWFNVDLPDNIHDEVQRITTASEITDAFYELFPRSKWQVEPVWGMNEVYVASKKGHGSDKVFYTKHIDGPWFFYPFASVYRCIVAVSKNSEIATLFPEIDKKKVLTDGDVCGFDFSREIHWINTVDGKANQDDDFRRICLKLHYVVYPKYFWWYGQALAYLTTCYNTAARQLFVSTLMPKTNLAEAASSLIVNTTLFAYGVQEYMGWTNVAYVLTCFWIGSKSDFRLRILMTSFVHYFKYLATYYYREDVCFQRFKRDSLFFKTVALVQIAWYYLSGLPIRASTLFSLLLVFIGYGLSGMATTALGMDLTYFGAELGQVKPKQITKFPYDVCPHPMIVGQVIALVGVHVVIRDLLPWLAPLHIACYLAVLSQEVFDFHKSPAKKSSSKSWD
eukprot:TRINITY_DN1243_c0_g1_i4.p1 TRINITY_DN1243_c0_g1~~TRINITY_DN1243_c0_g1_i4.p1  ORF type:complete len:583 (+),score=71.04 TRINITY_DN1243_c0_g1_i4:185-1933(+)